MKKLLLFSALSFLMYISAWAQAPTIQWQRPLGGTLSDDAWPIALTPDGGYITAGFNASADGDASATNGQEDIWVVKMTATGGISWQRSIGSSGDDVAQSLACTLDGGYIVTGSNSAGDGDVTGFHGNMDMWVVKLSATGSIEWQRSLGGSGTDAGAMVIQTLDSGYAVVGSTASIDGDVTGNHGGTDLWVLKLSRTGATEWQQTFGGTADDYGLAIRQAPDTGYIITGNTQSADGDVTANHGLMDVWAIKLSKTGALQWQRTFGGTSYDMGYNVRTTADHNYIIAARTFSSDGDVTSTHGVSDAWVIKLSATGSILWQRCYGGSDQEVAWDIIQTGDGGYVVSGATWSFDMDVTGNHGFEDAWIFKISPTGTLQWQKCMGGTSEDVAYTVQQTTDGYIVAGHTDSHDGDVIGNHGQYDGWVVKLTCGLEGGSISGPDQVCQGRTIILSTTTTAGGLWSTLDPAASVSPTGVVTGTAAGTATITYTYTNTCGRAIDIHTLNVLPAPAMPVITTSGYTISTTAGYASYQWLLGGVAIPGATNNTYTATENGSYSVLVSDASGCTATSGAYDLPPTGVNTVGNATVYNIAPNPTTGILNVTAPAGTTIKVYDIYGRELSSSTQQQLSIAHLPAGLHYVVLFDDAGALLYRDKILKQ